LLLPFLRSSGARNRRRRFFNYLVRLHTEALFSINTAHCIVLWQLVSDMSHELSLYLIK
jgi:hypothetical protein